MPTTDEFVSAARAYIGTPFVHQGRSHHGLDCMGLVVCAARDAGLSLIDRTDYSPDPGNLLIRELALQFVEVPDKQPGDILLMRFQGEPQHSAVLAGDTVIHGYATAGRVVEHRLDAKWQRRIVSVYRLREFA